LARAGLEPPSRWAGSPRAQEFVDELGFPPEYAGFQHRRRDPAFDVDGPIVLKPLHEFQVSIGKRIQDFLSKPKPERGLLSLPTGAGKTRVVVQAIVESMRRGTFAGSLVWVAQSDELCEQAVQSWAQVWRVFGPSQRLRISRLWGQTNNRVVAADMPHVVVATYQTLIKRLQSPAYNWLRQASCIVIDEAHGSISPSYTEILEGFGLTARTTDRPLIGLTATPFRSAADPAETQWLVNRYGQQRFDHGVIPGDDPYPVLQDMGVLAHVDQRVLEGSDLELTAAELAELVQFKRLPPSAESRLGESAPRNARLVESIKALPSDWPVLLFATSVEQAHLMAALLAIEGVSAKPISGQTDMGARRHYIEEFRKGNIRVLSNYNVLSTGFDAPALRALYIARPVYSPVLYQQMLGRGLRGPLNGGKDRCLVVNVQDNIAQFGEQLAFRHFEYLWQRDPNA
jgi:superfamily II DNA or RNA helicase